MKETITIGEIKRTTIYIERDLDELFDEICAREGSNKSKKTRELWMEYCNNHAHGNPQTVLQRHFEPSIKKCDLCHRESHYLNKTEFISGLIRFLCDDCLVKEKKRTVVKEVLCKV